LKIFLGLNNNNNNKKNHYEITTKPLKPRLKKLDVKGNGVIILFNEKQNYYKALRPKIIAIYFLRSIR
jgi:hypothetical protein